MKWMKFAALAALIFAMNAGPAHAASEDVYREQSDASKMMHKLGRGVVNVLTCWVEVPRNIASEWEKMDPVSGFFVGGIEGLGWGFARFASGVYEVFTFPLPIPEGYKPLIEPEFVVTDVWGDPIPGFDENQSVKPDNPRGAPIYPQGFSY